MKIIDGVQFFGGSDAVYSHGGPLALDGNLVPIGVYLPAARGMENVWDTDTLNETDPALLRLAASFKAMQG